MSCVKTPFIVLRRAAQKPAAKLATGPKPQSTWRKGRQKMKVQYTVARSTKIQSTITRICIDYERGTWTHIASLHYCMFGSTLVALLPQSIYNSGWLTPMRSRFNQRVKSSTAFTRSQQRPNSHRRRRSASYYANTLLYLPPALLYTTKQPKIVKRAMPFLKTNTLFPWITFRFK